MATCKWDFSGAGRWALACAGLMAVAGTAACSSEAPPGEDEAVGTSAQAFTSIGTTYSAGMRLTHDRMNATGFPEMKEAVGLAACDYKSLYMVRGRTDGTFVLYFSNNSGETFKLIGNAVGPHIACDHAQLLSLSPNSNNALRMARTYLDGKISGWSDPYQANKVDRIQGGDGTFYGVKLGTSGNQVFLSSNKSGPTDVPPTWGSSIASIGAVTVTGFGATKTGSDDQDVKDIKAWPRRAFALEASGTISYNDTLLTGSNLWTALNFGSERYFALSAAATHDPKNQPNAVYGLQRRNGTVELNRVRMAEVECHDGIDNDANGLTDGEDWACEQTFANEFCANRSNRNYCIQRGVSTWTHSVGPANPSLVTCMLGSSTAVKPGACFLGGSQDTLPALSSANMITPEPTGYGHWCNAHWSNGTWDVSWSATPCEDLIARGGTVVRAGLYSLGGKNNVLASCTDGYVVGSADGTTAMLGAKNSVRNGNKCIFTISPDVLPVFSRMFNPADQIPFPDREANGFVHKVIPAVPASPPNPAIPEKHINRFGVECNTGQGYCIGERAYDSPVNEGRPVYAVANGRVMINGSADRDLTSITGKLVGSSNQGEIVVEHYVGSGSYQEQFVASYAHLRKRLVQSGQTVRRGQLLGYVGATGNTGGHGHIHTGIERLSNVNAYTDTNRAFGWHLSGFFALTPTGTNLAAMTTVDALGWAGSYSDPWAYEGRITDTGLVDSSGKKIMGKGAWSIQLFKPGEGFAYPGYTP